MLRRFAFAAGLVAWIGVILAVVVPWNDFQGHTHWRKVAWIPFVSPPVKLLDVVANVLLYVPFGYLARRAITARVERIGVMALTMILSVALEATQLYSHWRFPSATDVACNLIGAYCGIHLAHASHRHSQQTVFAGVRS